MTKETPPTLSAVMTDYWADPAARAAHSGKMKVHWAKPETRPLRARAWKALPKREKDKRLAGIRSPEVAEKRSDSLRASANPGPGNAASWTPEARAKRARNRAAKLAAKGATK